MFKFSSEPGPRPEASGSCAKNFSMTLVVNPPLPSLYELQPCHTHGGLLGPSPGLAPLFLSCWVSLSLFPAPPSFLPSSLYPSGCESGCLSLYPPTASSPPLPVSGTFQNHPPVPHFLQLPHTLPPPSCSPRSPSPIQQGTWENSQAFVAFGPSPL